MALLHQIRIKALRPCYTSLLASSQSSNSTLGNTILPAVLHKSSFRQVTSDSSGMDPNVQKIAKNEKVEFWEKNRNLKRPISPHMTIYSWQYTNTLSITHRATGIMMYGGLFVLAVPYISLPYMFPAYITYLTSFTSGKLLLGTGKFLISLPVVYHSLNGVRHLFWDFGYGLNLENLKTTAYATVGGSLVISLILAFLKF